jgi:hypothetical protein
VRNATAEFGLDSVECTTGSFLALWGVFLVVRVINNQLVKLYVAISADTGSRPCLVTKECCITG